MTRAHASLLVFAFLFAYAQACAVESKPFHGKPTEIPGAIEAEDFDKGGEGVAYHVQARVGEHPSHRSNEAVCVTNCGDGDSGYCLGFCLTGQWINYTVNVAAAGEYTVEFRAATAEPVGGTFNLEFNGQNVTGPMVLPGTGGFGQYQTVSGRATLKAGVQVMRLCLGKLGDWHSGNINWFKFTPVIEGAAAKVADKAVEKPADPKSSGASPAHPVLETASPAVSAQYHKLAGALAQSGTAMLGKGNTEKAKEIFYRSLATDADCPEALYELGKLFEKENRPVAAGEFLLRASRLMAQEEKANPAFVPKRADAERRAKALNPFAARLMTMMEEYARELEGIAKRTPDSLTRGEALDRVQKLRLNSLIAPEKMPKIEPVAKAPPHGGGNDDAASSSSRSTRGEQSQTVLAPDVEVALKKSGWTKITGKWSKKAEGVYEVTDGKLEAQKTNGAVEVIIHKGNSATVKAFVRNAFNDYSSYYGETLYYYASGYGMAVKGSSCKLFTPYGWTNVYEPYMERDEPLPDANPKNSVMIMVQDTKLEYYLNGVKIRTANYKISKDGPFVIDILGTATIETPRNMGQ